MSKFYAKVLSNEDAWGKINSTLEEVRDTVCATFGPGAGYVMIANAINGAPLVTKDGVTVSNFLKFQDPIKNAISMLVNDAARNTVRIAGDGTTTCTLLTCELSLRIRKMIAKMKQDGQPVVVRKICQDLDYLLGVTLESLELGVMDIRNQDDLFNVALIACDGNKEIADIVSEAVWKVGKNGQVLAKESADETTKLEHQNGYVFGHDQGLTCIDERFLRDKQKNETLLVNPYVLIIDEAIDDYGTIETITRAYVNMRSFNEKKGKTTGPLLIIASDCSGGALATILRNLSAAPIYVVKCPDFNNRRAALLEDISWITGTPRVFSSLKGHPFSSFGEDYEADANEGRLVDMPWLEFGSAREIIIKKQSCTIKHNKSEEDIKSIISTHKTAQENTESPEERRFYDERISKLVSGIATIYIGAFSSTETTNRQLIIDDTIRSCFCAIRDGLLPGAGIALKEINLDGCILNYPALATIFSKAIKSPYRVIRENLEVETPEDIKEGFDNAYDPVNQCLVNALDAGIIDPYLVTTTALTTAVSATKQLVSTRVNIYSDAQ